MHIMLTLGTIAFGVTEAAYQTLRRVTRFRLPEEQRMGGSLGYQYTGPGEDGITLSGVIMPTYRGRPGMLADLRALALGGQSHTLSAGTGEQLGRWAVAELSEERSGLFTDGQARKIAFTVRLVHDDDAPAGELTALKGRAAENGDVRAVTAATAAAVARGDSSEAVVAAAQGAA